MTTYKDIIARENIKITSVFVPFSKSRNASNKHKSLNWRVTLWRGDTAILTTDYSAGCGHCPSYKNPKTDQWATERAIAFECEKGLAYGNGIFIPIEPDLYDVVFSLVTDSDVINYSDFEEWANSYGYNPDSRSAEKTYQDCMEIALQLHSGLGNQTLEDLKEAYNDY